MLTQDIRAIEGVKSTARRLMLTTIVNRRQQEIGVNLILHALDGWMASGGN